MKKLSLERVLPYLLIICGIIGFICAFVIIYEKLQLVSDSGYKPACDLNPVISCGSVMQSDQAEAFGFPNPLIGLGAFPVLAFVGVAMLAGARNLKRWFWLGLNGGLLLAVIFVHWLIFQTTYRINALCPYCVIVWIVTITSFWYVTLYNLDQKRIPLAGNLQKAYDKIRRQHFGILLIWFIVIAGLILQHFWYYYSRFL